MALFCYITSQKETFISLNFNNTNFSHYYKVKLNKECPPMALFGCITTQKETSRDDRITNAPPLNLPTSRWID